MSVQIENLLKIIKHSLENNTSISKACIDLNLHRDYAANVKKKINQDILNVDKDILKIDSLDALEEFCNNKGLDVNNVTRFWYKGQHIGKDRLSVLSEMKKDISIKQYIDENLIGSIKALDIPPPIKYKQDNKQSVVLELNLYDCHFGKSDFLTQEGTNETLRRFKESIFHFVAFTQHNYKIDKIVFAIGNDLFNVDNIALTTTRGTPQDNDMPYEKMFVFVQKLMIETIHYLSQFAPIDIIMVRGNHDYNSVFMLGQILEAYFTNFNDITIDNSLGRKYRKIGNTLVGFSHGDKAIIKNPAIILNEAKKLWVDCKYSEWHIGHFHGLKNTIVENLGICIRAFSSLSVNDRWHYEEGYIGNRISASALIHSLDNGILSTQTIMF